MSTDQQETSKAVITPKEQRSAVESSFLDREISWLEFNARVLEQVADRSVPLLERVNFLSIFSSNLDEFFMKRVAQLQRKFVGQAEVLSSGASVSSESLRLIRARVQVLMSRAELLYKENLKPELHENGISLIALKEATRAERTYARHYFNKSIFPLLTPFAIDASHPFPLLSNLSTSLGVIISPPESEDLFFARVKVSHLTPQWVKLPGDDATRSRFVLVEEIVQAGLGSLFPGMVLRGAIPFRVTRSSGLEVGEEEQEDLMSVIEENLRQRKFANVVRLEHQPNPDKWGLRFLCEELELDPYSLYERQAMLDFSNLAEIASLPLPNLKYRPWVPVNPISLPDDMPVFSTIRQRDVMVHHPYESFALSVERFVSEAADDPKVRSIKMTVYRVGDETPILPSLIRAAQNGKHVVTLLELKARFDEERNISWAQQLEEAGVHVVYGIPGLKTHAKTLLVVRDDPTGLRLYAHIATGNYHAKTSSTYTDIGLFTARTEITDDLLHFFNFLTGRSLKRDFQNLVVAPHSMESRFIAMINREIDFARLGKPARIIAKMNGLEDQHIIEKLYEASAMGVTIDLLVRGICSLRPGVPGLSDRIRVRSVVGRLLEHSRIIYFQNGQTDPLQGDFFISSADWMTRNLHRRVELAVPIVATEHKQELFEIFSLMLNDNLQAWDMLGDGTYQRNLATQTDATQLSSQEALMRHARERNKPLNVPPPISNDLLS